MIRIFRTSEVVKILSLNKNKFQDWLQRGFIRPSINISGRGGAHIFSFDDLLKIKTFMLLTEYGLCREKAKEITALSPYKGYSGRINIIDGFTEIILDKPAIEEEVEKLIEENSNEKT